MIITYCMMTMNRLYDTMRAIKRVKPYVDRVVIVDGGSTDDTILTLRNMDGVELYIHPWQDNFPIQRTNYLKHAGENGGTDWVLVSDPDELYSESTLKRLRDFAGEAGKYNMLAFESHSVRMLGDKVDHSGADDYWKALMFRYNPGIRYVGNPHETLIIEGGPKIKHVDGHYYHIKQNNMAWHRGARNAWIGGGGPNLGERQKLWRPFRQLVKDKTGIESWHDFDKYMIAGDMDVDIKKEFYKFKDEKDYDGASEWREFYKTYFRIYHPEEEPEEFKGERIE